MTENGLPCLELDSPRPDDGADRSGRPLEAGARTLLCRRGEKQRENNIEFLRNLPAGAGDRLALHEEYGEITMSQMLNEWALHDLGHIRQIAELARARRYQAGAGRMAASYDLKP